MENDSDLSILKELNVLINCYKVKLKMQYYDKSPFDVKDKTVISIIINYANKFENYKYKIFLLSTLGVRGFDEAVPYLIEQYKFFNLEIYSEPLDDLLLLDLCNTIAKIESEKFIDLYIEMLKLPATTALECIIKMLDKLNIDKAEEYIFSLIEKDNKIPKAWIGKPNEEDKYWCSQKAFEYIINRKNIKYYSFIEKFLNPEKLEWIQFTESKFQKENYSNCYNKYMQIAQKWLKYLDKVK